MNEIIPMNRPFIGAEEVDSVVKVLKPGWIITGPKCKAFEKEILTAGTPRTPVCVRCTGRQS